MLQTGQVKMGSEDQYESGLEWLEIARWTQDYEQMNTAFEQCFAIFNRLIEENPNDPLVYYYRGQCHRRQYIRGAGDDARDDAIADHTQAIALMKAKGSIEGSYEHVTKRKIEIHCARYDMLIALDPQRSDEMTMAIEDLTACIGWETKPIHYLRRADIYFADQCYDRALNDYFTAMYLLNDQGKQLNSNLRYELKLLRNPISLAMWSRQYWSKERRMEADARSVCP